MLELRNGFLYQDGEFVAPDNDVMERFWRTLVRQIPATARVLCTGLGPGQIQRLLVQKGCTVVTLEINAEIINDPDGVFDGISRPGIVIQADAWSWVQDRPFDFAIHDIWADIHNVPQGHERSLEARFPSIPRQFCVPELYRRGGF